ncbi:hypothetical protein GQ53DRAFT_61860 [Thozetella sp. PMI_491]|nr:hypothetical protein GQ53DRAFT_61860 [Thozetella sp. PMI_491]
MTHPPVDLASLDRSGQGVHINGLDVPRARAPRSRPRKAPSSCPPPPSPRPILPPSRETLAPANQDRRPSFSTHHPSCSSRPRTKVFCASGTRTHLGARPGFPIRSLSTIPPLKNYQTCSGTCLACLKGKPTCFVLYTPAWLGGEGHRPPIVFLPGTVSPLPFPRAKRDKRQG